MSENKATILIVEDDAFYREILGDSLKQDGFMPVSAENGLVAWNLLTENTDRFDAVLLDRKMPEMDGMEVLVRIKAHPTLGMLPVIMQTSMSDDSDVLEGLRAGANYYLTKPFEKDQLLAIVRTAVDDYQRICSLRDEVAKTSYSLSMMEQGSFTFQTLKQGRDLVTLIAGALPDASRIVMGLSELVINAIEHGNLCISYDDKTRLNKQGIWEKEIERRQNLPEFADKLVTLMFERHEHEVEFEIQDQGNGFDWTNYLEISPERAFDSHGRGIAMSRLVSFDRLEYKGNGNRVVATAFLGKADK